MKNDRWRVYFLEDLPLTPDEVGLGPKFQHQHEGVNIGTTHHCTHPGSLHPPATIPKLLDAAAGPNTLIMEQLFNLPLWSDTGFWWTACAPVWMSELPCWRLTCSCNSLIRGKAGEGGVPILRLWLIQLSYWVKGFQVLRLPWPSSAVI